MPAPTSSTGTGTATRSTCLLADAEWDGEDLARTAWRQTRRATLWLGAVPMLVFAVVGAVSGPVEIQAPAAMVPILVLAIPFTLLVRALYLTMTSTSQIDALGRDA